MATKQDFAIFKQISKVIKNTIKVCLNSNGFESEKINKDHLKVPLRPRKGMQYLRKYMLNMNNIDSNIYGKCISNDELKLIISFLNELNEVRFKFICNKLRDCLDPIRVLGNSVILLVVMNELNGNIVHHTDVCLQPRKKIHHRINYNLVLKYFKDMSNINAPAFVINESNYLTIYYNFVKYKSYQFLVMQKEKNYQKRKYSKLYNNNGVGMFNGYRDIFNVVLYYVCGIRNFKYNKEGPVTINFNDSKNKVNQWFHNKINRCTVDQTSIHKQMYLCLMSLNITCITDDLNHSRYNEVTNSIYKNTDIILKILKKHGILKLNITSIFLIHNMEWFHIIKANIMEYACKYCFNNDNWV